MPELPKIRELVLIALIVSNGAVAHAETVGGPDGFESKTYEWQTHTFSYSTTAEATVFTVNDRVYGFDRGECSARCILGRIATEQAPGGENITKVWEFENGGGSDG